MGWTPCWRRVRLREGIVRPLTHWPSRPVIRSTIWSARWRTALIALSWPPEASGHIAMSAECDAGATAVQLGTGFLLADEAGTNPVHRAALRDPQIARTVL